MNNTILNIFLLSMIFSANTALAGYTSGGGPILLQVAQLAEKSDVAPSGLGTTVNFADINAFGFEELVVAANPKANPLVSAGIDMISHGDYEGFNELAHEVNDALGVAGYVDADSFIDNVDIIANYSGDVYVSYQDVTLEESAAAFAKLAATGDSGYTLDTSTVEVTIEDSIDFQDSYNAIEAIYAEALDSL